MLGLVREYRLLNGKQIVGLLKNSVWTGKAYGEFKGHLMRFEKDTARRINILDIEGRDIVGTIEFSLFPRAATIRHEGEVYTWQYLKKKGKGSWLVGNTDEECRYQPSGMLAATGAISESYVPPIVLMAGLYIHSYFFRSTLLSIVVGFLLGLVLGYFII